MLKASGLRQSPCKTPLPTNMKSVTNASDAIAVEKSV